MGDQLRVKQIIILFNSDPKCEYGDGEMSKNEISSKRRVNNKKRVIIKE